MKPKWIKVGASDKDVFDIIEEIGNGKSIHEIVKADNSLSNDDIRTVLLRTKKYIQKHLILDNYLETTQKISQEILKSTQIDWSKQEITELGKLVRSGAEVEIIAQIMRKSKTEINQKLDSLNLNVKGVKENG